MSTTIDRKVVEMRFDNKNFENNVRESMSTLEKLKQKLKLSDASKGLQNLNTSANKVNMNGLSNAIDSVRNRFSVMEVVGITALANITNSAVNAGKRIVMALTIDPIRSGLAEYNTQLNATQTIMANVGHKGKTLEDVKAALKELNDYADQTIYNFTEMTKNIGLFTNAGVGLDESVAAIKGFSNAAAMSGTDSTRAASAMFQLSQAMSQGYVDLQTWNSLSQSNITGERFQQTIIETARAHGIAIDRMIKGEGSLRLTLKDRWLTTELMSEALNHYTLSRETMTEAEIKAAEAQLRSKGYTEEQIKKLFDLGTEATNAATKVKSFSQMWDVLKETAQSGWAQTWEIIFGDLEQAKAIFTPMTNFFGKIISAISDFRNKILRGAFEYNPFTSLMEKLEKSGIGKTVKKISKITKSLDYYQKMVNKVWRGDYKNQPYRFGLLEKEGHNPQVIQELVNKGYKYKLTVDDVAAAEKKHGIEVKETTKNVKKLSDAQLKEIGLNKTEIKMYRELEKQSKKTGKSIEEIVETMEKKDGRALLIESFANAGKGLAAVFKAIGDAWVDAFPPEVSALRLYNLIAAFNDMSKHFVMSKDTAKDLTRTLKGVFAIIDLISMVIGGGFKIAFTILKTVLGAFDLDILEFTAILGDVIVKFRDWIEEMNPLTRIIQLIIPPIIKMGKAIGDLAKKLWNLPVVKKFTNPIIDFFKGLNKITYKDIINGLKTVGNAIKNFFLKINDHFNGAPGDIIMGLANGLKNGAKKVFDTIVNIGKTLVAKFKEILGIHSPSKVFFAIGGFIIAGLIGGLLSGNTDLGSALGGIVDKITGFFGSIDWSKIFSTLMSAGMLIAVKKMIDSINNVTKLFGGLGDMFSGVGNVLEESAEGVGKILTSTSKFIKSAGRVLNGIAFKKTTEGIKNLGWTLLILVGAIAILTLLDIGEMWNAVAVIFVLSAILAGLTLALNKINTTSFELSKNAKGLKFETMKVSLLSIGAALLMMAMVVKTMGKMNPDQMKQGFIGLAGVVVALGGLIAAYGLLIKGKGAQNMDKAGKMMKKMATTLLLMVIVVKLISKLEWSEMGKGAVFITGFLGFAALLMLAGKIAGKNIDKVGKAISKIAWALLIMIAVVKLASKLEWSEMGKGAAFLAGFLVFVGVLVAITKIGKEQQLAKVGGMMLAISAALLIMVGVVKLISSTSWESLAKGALGITLLGAIVAGLLYMVKLIGPQAPKLAATILAIGVAIGILAGVAIVLSLINIAGLAKGIVAIGLLGLVMKGMIQATKGASDVKGSLVGMAIAIGVMAAAIAVLSFIDWKKLIAPTIAISMLMGMFALIESQSKHVTGSLGNLIAMSAAIVVMGTMLAILAKLPCEKTLNAAISLSLLMATLAGVMAVVSIVGKSIAGAAQGMTGLLLMCVPLVALVGVLYLMKGVKNATDNAVALTTLMITLTGVLAVLTVIGIAGPAALIGIGSLLALIVSLTAVVVAIGALMTKFPVLEKFLNKGLSVLVQIAEGLGEMIGAFVKGALTQISASLPIIGTNLSLFMKNVTPFITGAKMVDGNVLKGVGILAAAILALTAANLIQGIVSFSPMAKSFAQLGTDLSLFMKNLMPFITTAMLIPPQVLTSIKTLASAIITLTAANLIEGINRLLGGENSLEKFGSELGHLGKGLKNFITELGPIAPDQVESAKNAAAIIKTLAEAASKIPNTGGLLAELVGENDMGQWAQQLPLMAQGIVDFTKIITESGLEAKSIETAKTAAEVIKVLAKAASEIPNTGGLLAELVGDNPLDKFAANLPVVGKGIVGFIKALLDGKITADSIETAKTAASVIKTLAKVAQDIPDTGGFLAKLVGDNDLKKFANKLPDVAVGISGFAKKLGTFSDDKVATVNAAAKAITAIAKVGKVNLKDAGSNLSAFGIYMIEFAARFKVFLDSMAGASAESITSAITKLNDVISLAKSVAKTNVDSLGTFAKSLADAATKGVKQFVKAFNGVTPKNDAKKAAKELVQAAINGVGDKGKAEAIKEKAKSVSQKAVDAMCTKALKSDASSAGKDLVQGLINGLKNADKRQQVYDAAFSLGRLAVQGEKDGQESNSPSKATEKAGKWLGEGLIIGLDKMGKQVYESGSNIGKTATNSISNALDTALSLINSDMDAQPTIRPVLDLSDVESGAGYLNNMFNNGPSIGVMSNLNAISSGMKNRSQNGSNADVVTAIDKLRKDLGNVSGTTNNYNVNGVTYDDGSNITNAVQTLIRAAKVERRI